MWRILLDIACLVLILYFWLRMGLTNGIPEQIRWLTENRIFFKFFKEYLSVGFLHHLSFDITQFLSHHHILYTIIYYFYFYILLVRHNSNQINQSLQYNKKYNNAIQIARYYSLYWDISQLFKLNQHLYFIWILQ